MSAPSPFQDKPALTVDALAISRGARVLFDDLSFAAAPGDYVELRGANGSGKTSLLRALAGFLKPRAGRIHFQRAPEPTEALHYLGHLNGLKTMITARAHVRYWAGLFGGAESDALDRVGLARQADLPARVLSQGQARRLAVSRLLIAPRPIWLLDEPAAGLDADGRALLTNLIQAHCAEGGIALAAVHEPLGLTPAHTVTLA